MSPIAFAFVAGLLSPANPCGLAMLPAFVGYYLGTDAADTNRPAWIRIGHGLGVGAAVSAGFAAVFVAAGLVISAGLRSFVSYVPWAAVLIGALLVASRRRCPGPRHRQPRRDDGRVRRLRARRRHCAPTVAHGRSAPARASVHVGRLMLGDQGSQHQRVDADSAATGTRIEQQQVAARTGARDGDAPGRMSGTRGGASRFSAGRVARCVPRRHAAKDVEHLQVGARVKQAGGDR